jgi:hypothetical protein
MLARIIAVADTFDAVTTNRPYQTAHDPLDAVGIIKSLSGKRLDPQCVAALTTVFERGEIRIQRVAQASAAAAAAGSAPSAPAPLPVPPAPIADSAKPQAEPAASLDKMRV